MKNFNQVSVMVSGLTIYVVPICAECIIFKIQLAQIILKKGKKKTMMLWAVGWGVCTSASSIPEQLLDFILSLGQNLALSPIHNDSTMLD